MIDSKKGKISIQGLCHETHSLQAIKKEQSNAEKWGKHTKYVLSLWKAQYKAREEFYREHDSFLLFWCVVIILQRWHDVSK